MTNDQVSRQCGQGWAGLIDPLISEANSIGAEILSISERAGKLRVTYDDLGVADESRLAQFEVSVEQAEATSARVCEMCGKPARTRRAGIWEKALCDDDAKLLGYHQ